jgi:hypothetical protein
MIFAHASLTCAVRRNFSTSGKCVMSALCTRAAAVTARDRFDTFRAQLSTRHQSGMSALRYLTLRSCELIKSWRSSAKFLRRRKIFEFAELPINSQLLNNDLG